jgi:pilus assembly protein FimV
VGFGGINVASSLGQPLAAEIELVAVEKKDKTGLAAKLASPEAFKGAGIDYPYSLPKMKFKIETRPDGSFYVKASSDQAINEPFVSLLIELSWSSGRLLREYTFLLDPPGFVAEQPVVAAVTPIAPITPVVASAPVAASAEQQIAPLAPPVSAVQQAIPVPVPASQIAPPVSAVSPAAEVAPQQIDDGVTTADLSPAQEEKPVDLPGKKKTHASPVNTGQIEVKSGDTLSKIANRTKPSEVSLERMLVALYRANVDEFDGKNMNRINSGKILRMPAEVEINNIQQADAVNEVRMQVADWNAYRQRLAAATGSVAEQAPKQEASGKISTAVVDTAAPVAKQAAKEILKLSKGDALSDQTSAAGKATTAKEKASAKAMAKEEDSVAKTKALKEAEQRTALLEKNIKDMQRLVELRNLAAAAKVELNTASAPVSAVSAGSAVAAISEVVAAKPQPKIEAPKAVEPPPSLMDELLANPVALGGGAAVLLGLLGLGLMRARRGKAEPKVKLSATEAVPAVAARIAEPVAPSPETGDFTSVAQGAATVTSIDEVDPISEAEMFLNFGRDVQAEEVLKDALTKDPANNQIKLKLLSIYALRKDTKSFYVGALEIKESGDEAAWSEAAAMGRALEPNNSLYGGEGDAMPEVEVAQPEAAAPEVDFDLGFGAGDVQPMLDIQSVLESDTPEQEKTVIMSAEDMLAAQEAPMDFDISSLHTPEKSPAVEQPALDVASMDFDLTSSLSGDKVDAAEEPKLDINTMDFDLTSTHGAGADSAAVASDFNMPSMDFDLTETHTEKPAIAEQPAAVGEMPLLAEPVAIEQSVAAVEPAPVQKVAAEAVPAIDLDDLVFAAPTAKAADITPAPAATTPDEEADAGMSFNLDIPAEEVSAPAAAPAPFAKETDFSKISLDLDELLSPAKPAASNELKDERWQEVATKLDLARAYQEMGDQAGAREILDEVMSEGDDSQRAMAEELLAQISS